MFGMVLLDIDSVQQEPDDVQDLMLFSVTLCIDELCKSPGVFSMVSAKLFFNGGTGGFLTCVCIRALIHGSTFQMAL